jgi:hypothetical protein
MVVIFSISLLGTSHASTNGVPIKSGWSGYCLDDYNNLSNSANHQVDLWPCNNSEAQNWQLTMTQLKHGQNDCLTARSVTTIVLDGCTSSATQVWLRDQSGYINPKSGLCLTASNSGQGQLLNLASCTVLNTPAQSWTTSFNYNKYNCSGSQGNVVACNTVKEWISWQAINSNHINLLSNYTAGSSYEQWCADFVSYVYKESGHPFSNGNYNVWDENIASQIQNQGFIYHPAQGYTPQPGDVAFFDYPGGHVEIVVSGGPSPTFIYGDSTTADPTTGNGNMETNTITNEGSFGQVVYYLSPSSST